jgi:magnesium chelatase family protein
MGFARVMSRAQSGLAAPLVAVEVHLGSGLPQFNIVGLPAAAVKESRERVRAALATCGFELPAGRITVNLAPADLPKEGGRYDLPIALGILLASGQVQPRFDVDRTEFYGELGLTGELKPVPGLLLAALHAVRAGHSVLVPRCNLAEVRAADAAARALGHLRALADEVEADDASPPDSRSAPVAAPAPRTNDLADVRGQHQAKRALLLAAAGGHSLLMIGPPGSGKTMLAQRLPGLLPPLDADQALEIAAICAVAPAAAGTSIAARPPAGLPPFRAPHHTASAHAIVGGGSAVQPGEVSLAHHGVLFLDELPEFDRRVLESLREPLESGRVSVVRASQRAEFPASFLLVAAMNPCPCGRHGMVQPACQCHATQIARYRGRISGPLLDRIDLQLRLPQVKAAELLGGTPAGAMTSAQARRLVERARQRQLGRQGCLNARLAAGETLRHCQASAAGLKMLERAAARGASARAQHRMLRVARTIADLEGRDDVDAPDIAEAAAMRIED